MKPFDAERLIDVPVFIRYLALYLTVTSVGLWAVARASGADVGLGGTWGLLVAIVLLVDTLALVVASRGRDPGSALANWPHDSPWRGLRSGIRNHRRSLYVATWRVLLLAIVAWVLSAPAASTPRLGDVRNMLFYLTLCVALGTLVVYLRFDRGVADRIRLVRHAFVALVLLTALTGTALTEAVLAPVDPRPLHAVTFIVGAVVLFTHADPDSESVDRPTRSADRTPGADVRPSAGVLADWYRAAGRRFGRTVGGSPLVLGVLLAGGMVIRLHELAALPPYPDEYNHLLAARRMLWSGRPLPIPAYTRSFATVTLPVYVSFHLFGPTVYAARLVTVAFNVLAAIPLYWLVRRIDRPTAIVATTLYLFNPWAIAISRTVREYAVMPFYLLFVALALVKLLDRLGSDLALPELLERRAVAELPALTVVVVLPILYGAIVDPRSTFIAVSGLYVIFAIGLVIRLDRRDDVTRRVGLATVPLLALVVWYLVLDQSFLSLQPAFNDFAGDLFFGNPAQQWYHDRSAGLVRLVLLFAFGYVGATRHPTGWFCAGAFLGYFYVMELHFARYTRPRYAFVIEPWFVVVVAMGLSFLGAHLASVLKPYYPRERRLHAVFFLALLVSLVNPTQIALAATLHENYGGTYTPITGEHHVDAERGLDRITRYADRADLVLIHRPAHLRWYHPTLAERVELRQYRCDDGTGDGYGDRLVGIDRRQVLLVTSWRSDRGDCIASTPALTDFRVVHRTNGYALYANFDPAKRSLVDGLGRMAHADRQEPPGRALAAGRTIRATSRNHRPSSVILRPDARSHEAWPIPK